MARAGAERGETRGRGPGPRARQRAGPAAPAAVREPARGVRYRVRVQSLWAASSAPFALWQLVNLSSTFRLALTVFAVNKHCSKRFWVFGPILEGLVA